MEQMDRHDLCRIRDDVATILMAVQSMKKEVEQSDLKEYIKKNMLEHFDGTIEELNFIIVIVMGITQPGDAGSVRRQ